MIKDYICYLGYEWGVDCSNIPIRISKRMTNTWGHYTFNAKTFKPLEFVFSHFLLDGSYTDEEIKSVLKHEFCHYYVNTLHKKDCKHNNEFQKACKFLNIDGSRYSKLKISENLKNYISSRNKYKVTCNKCGITFFQKRLPNHCTLENYNKNYRCASCKGTLEIKPIK